MLLVSNTSIQPFAFDCEYRPEYVMLVISDCLVILTSGKDLKEVSSDKAMVFDPIRQHRHFCPWIAPMDKGAPGWQQTLYALQRQQGYSPPPSKNSPSASIIKVFLDFSFYCTCQVLLCCTQDTLRFHISWRWPMSPYTSHPKPLRNILFATFP